MQSTERNATHSTAAAHRTAVHERCMSLRTYGRRECVRLQDSYWLRRMAELGGSEAAGAGAVSTPEGTWPSLNDIGAELLFEKVLTSCDAASRGRIVLPKVRSCPCGMCYHRTLPKPVTPSTIARWFAC